LLLIELVQLLLLLKRELASNGTLSSRGGFFG
jgi:hypothetical protein